MDFQFSIKKALKSKSKSIKVENKAESTRVLRKNPQESQLHCTKTTASPKIKFKIQNQRSLKCV
jgi:hypothetical protein